MSSELYKDRDYKIVAFSIKKISKLLLHGEWNVVFYSKDACGHARVAFGAFVSCFESHVPRAYMTVLFNVAHKPIQKI
jgi:hypothetical protein